MMIMTILQGKHTVLRTALMVILHRNRQWVCRGACVPVFRSL